MALTYEYFIKGLSTDTARIKRDEYPDTVRAIHWDLVGTDENGNTDKINDITTFVQFRTENTGSFTPYDNLTQQQIQQWIDSVADTASYKLALHDKMKRVEQKIVTTHFDNLPWNKN